MEPESEPDIGGEGGPEARPRLTWDELVPPDEDSRDAAPPRLALNQPEEPTMVGVPEDEVDGPPAAREQDLDLPPVRPRRANLLAGGRGDQQPERGGQ